MRFISEEILFLCLVPETGVFVIFGTNLVDLFAVQQLFDSVVKISDLLIAALLYAFPYTFQQTPGIVNLFR